MMITLLVCLSNILCSSNPDKDNVEVESEISRRDTAMNEMRDVVGEIVQLAMIERVNQRIIESVDCIVKEAFKDITSDDIISAIYGVTVSPPGVLNDPMIVQLSTVIFAEIYSGTKDIKDIDLEETVGSIIRDIAGSISPSLVKTNISKELKDLLTKQSVTTMLGYFSPPEGESPEVNPKTLRANDLLNLFKEFNVSGMKGKGKERLTVEEKEKGFREIFNKVFGGACTTFHLGLMNCVEGMSITKEELLDELYEEFERGSTLFYSSKESDKRKKEFIRDPESFIACDGYFTKDSGIVLDFDGSVGIIKSETEESGRIHNVLVLLYCFEIRDPTTSFTPSQDPNPTTSNDGVQ